MDYIVAIDGPSGSGKSTIAREVASRLGGEVLDTGAMYRAVAWFALEHGVEPTDAEKVADLLKGFEVHVGGGVGHGWDQVSGEASQKAAQRSGREAHEAVGQASDQTGDRLEKHPQQSAQVPQRPAQVKVGNSDITEAIRTPEVTAASSIVAANPAVRKRLRQLQRDWAEARGGGVVEGRDIGTDVFPEARHKFYLTASAHERATRRADETGASTTQVLPSLQSRDAADTSRQHSPLRKADDATELDTTGFTVKQTVEKVLSIIASETTSGGVVSTESDARYETKDTATKDKSDQQGSSEACATADRSTATKDKSDRQGKTESKVGSKDSSAYDFPDRRRADEDVVMERDSKDFSAYDFPAAKHYGKKRSVGNRIFYSTARRLCLLISGPYLRQRIRNRGYLPAQGPVIVAPGGHRSNLDTLLVGMAVRRSPLYMAKDSLFKSRFWSSFIRAFGGFPVARDKLDRRALETAVEVLERGDVLIVFPEGARQEGPKLQPLFIGVAWLSAKTGAPVVPLGIGGSQKVMPIGKIMPRPHRIRMILGEPMPPPQTGNSASGKSVTGGSARASREARDAFTQNLSEKLQALFDEAQEWAGTPNTDTSQHSRTAQYPPTP